MTISDPAEISITLSSADSNVFHSAMTVYSHPVDLIMSFTYIRKSNGQKTALPGSKCHR